MTYSANELIEKLKLEPHPEGGYFRETYRSAGVISHKNLLEDYTGDRNFSTCIYFLLIADKFSAFHRIKQDEIWHFYNGATICLYMISPSGQLSSQLIGRNLDKGEVPQFMVPGGYWFAAEVGQQNSYSLVGCTVAPGFDFADFELESCAELTTRFPQHQKLISRLTHH